MKHKILCRDQSMFRTSKRVVRILYFDFTELYEIRGDATLARTRPLVVASDADRLG